MRAANTNEVVLALDRILADSRYEAQPLGLFPALYRQVTLAVRRGIALGLFEDGPRMDAFDTQFANRYLVALDRWQRGLPIRGAWQQAFDFGQRGQGIAMQHLMLGMNAHINLDLGVAAAAVAPGASLPALHRDFNLINDLLEAMIDDCQQVLDRYSPVLDLLDRVGGRKDEAIADFSMRRARAAAWEVAEGLAHLEGPARRAAVGRIDRRACEIGRRVAHPGPVLGLAIEAIALVESTDHRSMIAQLNRIVPAD